MKKYRSEGYIYFLKAPDGLYKIGRAAEVTKRLKQIQPAYPYDLDFVLILFSLDAVGDEQFLHRHFAGKRLQGEWFKLDDEDLDSLPLDNPQLSYQQYLEQRVEMSVSIERDSLYSKLLERCADEDDEELLRAAIARLVALELQERHETISVFDEMLDG